MPAVITEGLSKKYSQTMAIDSLTLEIGEGQIFGLVGPDGAGKTSLFQILAGILSPSSGKASVLGHDVVKDPEKLKQELGYMAQKFALYTDLTVRENLDFFAEIFASPRADLEERKLKLLRFADLERFQDRLAGALSGGMKQKLALCCTLIHTPRILILDEPTFGVDPVSRQEFWEMLLPLPQQGTTVVVSTAYMDEADKCDRVALIYQGKILESGTPAALRALLQDKIYEIRGPKLWETKQLLTKSGLLQAVQVFGDRLHVQLRTSVIIQKLLWLS